MRIAITGITGMVGSRLAMLLLEQDHDVVGLTRNQKSAQKKVVGPIDFIEWDGNSSLDPKLLNDIDAVVHLAGESIAAGRWSESQKKRLYDSRVKMTNLLVDAVNKVPMIKTFVGASAVGFYGDRDQESLDENSAAGSGFLADLSKDWELSYASLNPSVRKTILRIGVVLGSQGGMLEKLIPIFQKYVGGKVGDGKQWLSWIHIEDLCRIILHSLKDNNMSGTYNATAPEPVQNQTLSTELAKTLGRPCLFPVPSLALKAVFGEMSQLMLGSTRALPKKLLENGYSFVYKKIHYALEDVCSSYKGGKSLLLQNQWLDLPQEKVFDFFSDPYNLEKITPPFLKFRVAKMHAPKIKQGALIDYKLSLRGLPISWRTEIQKWQPIQCFVDRQLKGPYSVWHHTHEFKQLKGGTLIKDIVRYKVPMGVVGDIVAGWYVRSDVQKIFSYRFDEIQKYLK